MSRIVSCSIILAANAAALIVAAGQPAQLMVSFVSAAVFAAFAVDFALQASIRSLNRFQRHCRESLMADRIASDHCSDNDREAVRLRTNVEAMRQHEMKLVNCYSQRRCATEDVVRATALRLLAEIQLLRYEKMPRTWAKKCAARQPADSGP